MRSQKVEFTSSFSRILDKAWGRYFISVCGCKKEISALKGRYIYNFIDIITDVVDFISREFKMTDPIERFCT